MSVVRSHVVRAMPPMTVLNRTKYVVGPCAPNCHLAKKIDNQGCVYDRWDPVVTMYDSHYGKPDCLHAAPSISSFYDDNQNLTTAPYILLRGGNIGQEAFREKQVAIPDNHLTNANHPPAQYHCLSSWSIFRVIHGKLLHLVAVMTIFHFLL